MGGPGNTMPQAAKVTQVELVLACCAIPDVDLVACSQGEVFAVGRPGQSLQANPGMRPIFIDESVGLLVGCKEDGLNPIAPLPLPYQQVSPVVPRGDA
jgi:hypothetical protein